MLNRMVIMFSELNVVSRNFADMLAPAESKTRASSVRAAEPSLWASTLETNLPGEYCRDYSSR